MWFIVVEVEQETSAPPPKKNPGSAPVALVSTSFFGIGQEWSSKNQNSSYRGKFQCL